MSASHHYVCQECNPSIASLFTHHRPTGVQPFHSFIASMHNLSPHPYTHPVSTLYPITTQPSTPYPPSTLHHITTQPSTPYPPSTLHPITIQPSTPYPPSILHPITQPSTPYPPSTIHPITTQPSTAPHTRKPLTPLPSTHHSITPHGPQHTLHHHHHHPHAHTHPTHHLTPCPLFLPL